MVLVDKPLKESAVECATAGYMIDGLMVNSLMMEAFIRKKGLWEEFQKSNDIAIDVAKLYDEAVAEIEKSQKVEEKKKKKP